MKLAMIMLCAALLCACGGGHKEKTFSQEENVENMSGATVETEFIDSIIATDWMRRYVDSLSVGCVWGKALKRKWICYQIHFSVGW